MNEAIVEVIDSDLEGLIPRFLDFARKDLSALRDALVEQDYETLARLGHNAKGAGRSYGFNGMAEIGSSMEEAARAKDFPTVEKLVDRFADYLERVEVRTG